MAWVTKDQYAAHETHITRDAPLEVRQDQIKANAPNCPSCAEHLAWINSPIHYEIHDSGKLACEYSYNVNTKVTRIIQSTTCKECIFSEEIGL